MKKFNVLVLTVTLVSAINPAFAKHKTVKEMPNPAPTQEAAPTATTVSTPVKDENEAEWANVDKIKEKYWARGDESELGVVQNRLYSKENKVELSVFTGLLSTDPFLSVKTVGGLASYHLTEYLSLGVLGWKDLVSPSAALDTFRDTSGAVANTNEPKSFLGAEASASVLYGKLSVLGKAIIYYDLNFLGGLGVTNTESGKYLTPYAGIGQQIYLSKLVSLRFDYRLMHYSENILEKEIPTKMGSVVGSRGNWTHSFNVGVSFLLGGKDRGGKEK